MATGLLWVRVDSDLAHNPKIVTLIANHGQRGMAAAFMFICSIGHAAAHNTDGAILKPVLPFIHGTPTLARILVEAGLWEEAEQGWRIAKYYEHQPTKATREAVSEARSEAARKAANARWGNA
ncbi:hypothetical protein ABE10_00915 [Bacillus toyonensis]|nr:hypothetical protein [Bacillus toyonensis]